MTRPRYETAADRTRESGAAIKFSSHFRGMELTKMEAGGRADFTAAVDGKDVAYVEVKTRTCASSTYATYHISKDKLVSLQRMAERDSLSAVLLVQWTDKAGFVFVKDYLAASQFKKGGRWDRNDSFDVEEMAEAPITLFKMIG